MKGKQIINIINFIRGIEPRNNRDIYTPVVKQIELMKEHKLRGTFLLQYDALIMPEYLDLLKPLDPEQFEIGVWFETVQPQVEAAGLKWRGSYPWDWRVCTGFSMGYNKEEREKLVDVLYEKFKDTFGYYPKVFGSWFFDSHTIRYISDKYGVDALCNCKEQFGTDGYTLWGGYFGQGYYPSRTNVFLPAQTPENQIPAPIFRMLGSDPIYQYDFGLNVEADLPTRSTCVLTLEPGSTVSGGKDTKWIEWFLKENFNGDCLSFGYAQAGQENSFSWELMGEGINYQFPRFGELQKQGEIIFEQLGETGRRFKETYKMTPASTITSHCAFDDENKNNVWYCSKNYRISLYGNEGKMRIRDLHIFKEDFADPFEDTVCKTSAATYDTPPVIDGYRNSGKGVLSGGYIEFEDGSEPTFDKMNFEEIDSNTALVSYGSLKFMLFEDGIEITADKPFSLTVKYGGKSEHFPALKFFDDKILALSYKGTDYSIKAETGIFTSAKTMKSQDNKIKVIFN